MHFDSHKTYFPTHKITCPSIITDLIVIKACKNIIIAILYKRHANITSLTHLRH